MSTNTHTDPLDVIHRAQMALAKFLTTDSGVSEKDCISELLGILDSREAALLTAHIQRRDDERVIRRAMTRAFLEFMQVEALKQAAAMPAVSAEDPQDNITRQELARVRKHETHLLQERDRLIKELVVAQEDAIAAHAKLDAGRKALA